VARVSKPPTSGGHGSIGDNLSPHVVSGDHHQAVSYENWAVEAAKLEAASRERESSLNELQAMLASMGQPAPPPPPTEAPPVMSVTSNVVPAAPAPVLVVPAMDIILPPPSPVKVTPVAHVAPAVPKPVAFPVPVVAPVAPVVPVPVVPAPPVAAVALPPVAPTPAVAPGAAVSTAARAEVSSLLAAQTPAVVSQQCTAEVSGLLDRYQEMVIPPPLSRQRFKMKMASSETAAVKPVKGPPLGTAAAKVETEKFEVKAIMAELKSSKPVSVSVSVVAAETKTMEQEIADEIDAMLSAKKTPAVVQSQVVSVPVAIAPVASSEQTLLSEAEDFLFAEAVSAEAKRLELEEAALDFEDESVPEIVTDAVELFDDAAALEIEASALETETPVGSNAFWEHLPEETTAPEPAFVGSPVGVGLTEVFPEAVQWSTPQSVKSNESAFSTPSEDLEFPNKLARAVRSITNWFTGVPFLDFEEPPSPVVAVATKVSVNLETVVVTPVATLPVVTPVASGAVARALQTFDADAGTLSVASSVASSVSSSVASSMSSSVEASVDLSSKSNDLYGANEPIVLDPASSAASLEEMDYEEYLEFHDMEVLEGTPPQVLQMMVAELKASDAADAVRVLDAKDAQRAISSSTAKVETAAETAAGIIKDLRDPKSAVSTLAAQLAVSEDRAQRMASEVTRLEAERLALTETASAAKTDAEQSKELLQSLYTRGERVDELYSEAEKWKAKAEAAEKGRVAYMEAQSKRKAQFVAGAEQRVNEAVAAAARAAAEARELRERLCVAEGNSAKSAKTHEDVSVQVKTLKQALQETQQALEKAEADAMHLARTADAAAKLKTTKAESDELRAARRAAAEAAEDAATKILSAAEKLLDAKARAVRLEEVVARKDFELVSVRAELETAYAKAAESMKMEKELKDAAAAAAFCAATGLIAAWRANGVNGLVFA
jgi:colicin import membrane protein